MYLKGFKSIFALGLANPKDGPDFNDETAIGVVLNDRGFKYRDLCIDNY